MRARTPLRYLPRRKDAEAVPRTRPPPRAHTLPSRAGRGRPARASRPVWRRARRGRSLRARAAPNRSRCRAAPRAAGSRHLGAERLEGRVELARVGAAALRDVVLAAAATTEDLRRGA